MASQNITSYSCNNRISVRNSSYVTCSSCITFAAMRSKLSIGVAKNWIKAKACFAVAVACAFSCAVAVAVAVECSPSTSVTSLDDADDDDAAAHCEGILPYCPQ